MRARYEPPYRTSSGGRLTDEHAAVAELAERRLRLLGRALGGALVASLGLGIAGSLLLACLRLPTLMPSERALVVLLAGFAPPLALGATLGTRLVRMWVRTRARGWIPRIAERHRVERACLDESLGDVERIDAGVDEED